MTPRLTALLAVPAVLPLAIGREEAREEARRELSRPVYHQDDPSLTQRLAVAAYEAIRDFVARAAESTPGGWLGLVAIIVLLVLAATAVLLRVGPIRRGHASGASLHVERALTARDYRERAEQAAAQERWAEAIRERLLALSAACAERGILDPRTGRTATELAATAGAAFPDQSAELRAAARLFDDVWYGERTATAAGYQRVRDLDRRVNEARPAVAGAGR